MTNDVDRISLLKTYREKMIALEVLSSETDAMIYIEAMVGMKRAADACREAGIDEEVLWQIRRSFLKHAEFMTDER